MISHREAACTLAVRVLYKPFPFLTIQGNADKAIKKNDQSS